MKYLPLHDVLPLPAAGRAAACAACAATFAFFVTMGLPTDSGAAQQFVCTFAASPTDCGFIEQKKEDGQPRATIVPIGRDGPTGVRLHTEPGDNNVAGSGDMERNDLYLAQPGTADPVVFNEGEEHWWAHSILFPDDFAAPTWQMYPIFGFHHTGPTGQGNFDIHFQQRPDTTQPGDLVFRGFGGTQDSGFYTATIAPGSTVSKNVWYDFVYHVKWSSGQGYFDAWVRKGDAPTYTRVLAHRGPTLYVNQGTYLKLANYHTPVCDPYPVCKDQVPSMSPPSSVIHDRVIRGTTWQDVVMPGASLEGQHEENAASYQSNLVPSSWGQYGPETGTFSGGTIRASNVAGDTATFTFTGSTVVWMGVKCTVCGFATVSIDGGAPTAVDTTGPGVPGSLSSEAIFTASGLAPGASHTMVITVTGAHSSGSADNYIAVDGFWVIPPTVTASPSVSPPAAAVRRFEETDASVSLSAGWVQTDPNFYEWSGGSSVNTVVPGARATLSFTGPSVTWIGYRSVDSGIARVFVDGVFVSDVDLFARRNESNSRVHTVKGLSNGSHTLTIETTGMKNPESLGTMVIVDAFDVPAPAVSHLQEADPDISYSAGWTGGDISKPWSGGSAAFSATPGAQATLTFRGTAIGWIGSRGPDAGIARVFIDGSLVGEVDTYAPGIRIQATVFEASGLADTNHTLTIQVTGSRNGASTGTAIWLDAFDVTTPGTRSQEEDAAVAYSGVWTHGNLNKTWSEGTVATSNVPGSQATFTFTGSSVSWIGCRRASTGIARVYLDGVFVAEIDTFEPFPIEGYQNVVFRADGLASGTHTLTIEATGRKNPAADSAYVVVDAFDVRP